MPTPDDLKKARLNAGLDQGETALIFGEERIMDVKRRTPEFEYSLARQTAILAMSDWVHSRILVRVAKVDARCKLSTLVADNVKCTVDGTDPQHLRPYAVY